MIRFGMPRVSDMVAWAVIVFTLTACDDTSASRAGALSMDDARRAQGGIDVGLDNAMENEVAHRIAQHHFDLYQEYRAQFNARLTQMQETEAAMPSSACPTSEEYF